VTHRPSILIVEDDEAVREVLVMFLEDAGYAVEYASDGGAALELLEEGRPPHQPDLILLDLLIPRVDGLTVLERLATLAPRVPVIAMSASSLHLQRAAAVGARETVQKPFDINRVLAVVARWCPTLGRSEQGSARS
jgi:two-component system, OmpR family, response regulator MprA